MKPLRTAAEQRAGEAIAEIFDASADTLEARLEAFPRYARRKTITRFISLYELFKKVQHVKGSIVECGVYRGFSLMTWAHLSAVMEPANLTRRIYGFDSFSGFPAVGGKDHNAYKTPVPGELRADAYEELLKLIDVYDQDRFLGHIDKVSLIRGDVTSTVTGFVEANRHLVVSLLFMDVDLYEPTSAVLRSLLPRMPKGSVIAFDQLDNPIWPGETEAAMETIGLPRLQLQRFDWDPYIAYAVL